MFTTGSIMSDFNSIFFQAERPLLKEITSNRLNTILQEIRRNKPKGERGITVRHSGDGTYIGLAASLPRGSFQADHPFKVVFKKINDQWHWGVIEDSKLFTDIVSVFAIDGLLSTQSDNDTAWLPIQYSGGKDYIYLQWDEENAEARIDSVGSGGTLDPEASFLAEGFPIEIDTESVPTQFQFARKIIAVAEDSADENSAPTLLQGITSHQLLQNICYAGMPAKWFFDYSGQVISP